MNSKWTGSERLLNGISDELTERLSSERRLAIIRELLSEVVPGIRTIQCALEQSDDSSDLAYLAAAALSRLGWITEQGCMIAGYEFGQMVGATDYWLLGSRNVLSELREEVKDEAV